MNGANFALASGETLPTVSLQTVLSAWLQTIMIYEASFGTTWATRSHLDPFGSRRIRVIAFDWPSRAPLHGLSSSPSKFYVNRSVLLITFNCLFPPVNFHLYNHTCILSLVNSHASNLTCPFSPAHPRLLILFCHTSRCDSYSNKTEQVKTE